MITTRKNKTRIESMYTLCQWALLVVPSTLAQMGSRSLMSATPIRVPWFWCFEEAGLPSASAGNDSDPKYYINNNNDDNKIIK